MRKSQTDLMLFGDVEPKGKKMVLSFPSFGAFLDVALAVDAPQAIATATAGDFCFQGYSYYETDCIEEANSFAINGVPGLDDRISELSAGIKTGAGHLEEYTYRERSVVGGRPNRSAYLTGEPRNMWRIRHSHREGGKIITINTQAAFSGMVNSEYVILRGAAIIALTELLESNGYRVEINAISGVRSDSRRQLCAITKIKAAEEFSDITRIGYALAHPSFLRRHSMRLFEGLPDDWVKDFEFHASGGYSRPDDSLLETVPGDIYLQGDSLFMQANFSSMERGQAWVKKQLKEQGVSEEE